MGLAVQATNKLSNWIANYFQAERSEIQFVAKPLNRLIEENPQWFYDLDYEQITDEARFVIENVTIGDLIRLDRPKRIVAMLMYCHLVKNPYGPMGASYGRMVKYAVNCGNENQV